MSDKNAMNRRRFLQTSALSMAGAGIHLSSNQLNANEKTNPPPIKINNYRTLGRTGFKTSDIGAGKPGNPRVLQLLMDAGVNYIDTAEMYGAGHSEKTIGEAIKGRDRKTLFINSKLKMTNNPNKEQILRRARKCLERLQTDYLDCMMIHSCPTSETVNYQPFHDAMAQLKREGKLRFVGISSHGVTYNEEKRSSMEKVLLAAVKDGRFDLMLLVYNFLNREMGETVLKACHDKNIGTVLMKINPVGNYDSYKSKLQEAIDKKRPTEKIRQRMEQFEKRLGKSADFLKKNNLKLEDRAGIRSAAYRFVLDNKNAHCALYNFSNFQQIDNVLGISGIALSSGDRKTLAALTRGCDFLYCRHACGICQDKCPTGVPINTIMRYNYYFETKMSEKYAMEKYAALPGNKADQCLQCSGMCKNACPHGVSIQELLAMAHNNLTLG
ncbi:MAG: hypothetical protein GY757_11020 [bacterium]|nr:hypothetical protein [bacterium]